MDETNAERVADEVEVLASMYGEEVVRTEAASSVSGGLAFGLDLPFATLSIFCPADYPSHAPPAVAVTAVPGRYNSAWIERLSATVAGLAVEAWTETCDGIAGNGEVVLFDVLSRAEDLIEADAAAKGEEADVGTGGSLVTGTGTAAVAGGEGEGEDRGEEEEEPTPPQTFPLRSVDEAAAIEASLDAAGFRAYGGLRVCEMITVSIEGSGDEGEGGGEGGGEGESHAAAISAVFDGGEQADLNDYVEFTIESERRRGEGQVATTGGGAEGGDQGRPVLFQTFGADLLEWARAAADGDTPGFSAHGGEGSGDDGEADAGGVAASSGWEGIDVPDHLVAARLPSPADLGVDPQRELVILTWGRALMKSAPKGEPCVCVCVCVCVCGEHGF